MEVSIPLVILGFLLSFRCLRLIRSSGVACRLFFFIYLQTDQKHYQKYCGVRGI